MNRVTALTPEASAAYEAAMQEFLDFVLRQLVEYPDDMILTKVDSPKKVVFKLRIHKSDIGRIVGKHGQTIAAIRNLLNAAASRHGQKAMLDIIEDEQVEAAHH